MSQISFFYRIIIFLVVTLFCERSVAEPAAEFDGQKFIAHCDEGEKVSLAQSIKTNGRYLVLIGPEGDFTPAEVDSALQNGYKAITLGESRLRTETAALEACFEANFLNR